MTEAEVIEAINYVRKYNTETNMIEVKTASMDFPKKCYDTFSSFSNKYGGIIIFGINEENGFKTEDVYDLNDLQKKFLLCVVILWNRQLDLIFYLWNLRVKIYWLLK